MLALPATLDETYERMLITINREDRSEAATLLQWLVYAQSPLSLAELAEATIIDNSTANGIVDFENRGDWEDTLEILAGLVTVIYEDTRPPDQAARPGTIVDSTTNPSSLTHRTTWKVGKETKIRLAHFSVKEYLESPRLKESSAGADFHMSRATGHSFLGQSCIAYLTYYSGSSLKSSSVQDLTAFPLLEYAARSWFHHGSPLARGCDGDDGPQGMRFLTLEQSRLDWLQVYQPDLPRRDPFGSGNEGKGSGLYYASVVGLLNVVSNLIDCGHDVNDRGGWYGNALQGASAGGYLPVVQTLLGANAEVNAQGGYYHNALEAASAGGFVEIAKALMDVEADVNAQGGWFCNALQAAAAGGHEQLVQMLLDSGAGINFQGGWFGNALQGAAAGGYQKVVEILVRAGAEVDVQGGYYGNALQAAARGGHEIIVDVLLHTGKADVNTQGGRYGTALQAASAGGQENVIELLLRQGAAVNSESGFYSTALQAASRGGHEKSVHILLDAGANADSPLGGRYGTALQGAMVGKHENIVKILLAAGAGGINEGREATTTTRTERDQIVAHRTGNSALQDSAKFHLQQPDGLGRSSIHVAASYGSCEGVRQAINQQQDLEDVVNSRDHQHWTALHWAAFFGNVDVVELLLRQFTVDWRIRDRSGWRASQVANFAGQEDVVELLLSFDALRGDVETDDGADEEDVVPGQTLRGYCNSCGHVSLLPITILVPPPYILMSKS